MQTYGEKAVGLNFNPSGDEIVTNLKQAAADFIDQCNEARGTTRGEKATLFELAIRRAQEAQMLAVKAATWKDDD